MELQIFKTAMLYIIGIVLNEVACKHVFLKELNILSTANNVYFGKIAYKVKTINSSSSSLRLTIPILQTLDPNLKISLDLNMTDKPDESFYIDTLCNLLPTEQFFEGIRQKIKLSGRNLPKKCPIPAGSFKLNNYVLNLKSQLPTGLAPTGNFKLNLQISVPKGSTIIQKRLLATEMTGMNINREEVLAPKNFLEENIATSEMNSNCMVSTLTFRNPFHFLLIKVVQFL